MCSIFTFNDRFKSGVLEKWSWSVYNMGTGKTPTNPRFVPVVGSSPTKYHILNFTLNSLIMEFGR